jgi:hypothetical protein
MIVLSEADRFRSEKSHGTTEEEPRLIARAVVQMVKPSSRLPAQVCIRPAPRLRSGSLRVRHRVSHEFDRLCDTSRHVTDSGRLTAPIAMGESRLG